MKGKILGNFVTLPRCRSELSNQSIGSSSSKSKTNGYSPSNRKSIPQKKIKTHRKLSNSTPNFHADSSMDEVESSIEKPEFLVSEQERQPRTSIVWLQRLYELWEPQLCESYRPGVQSPLPSEDNEEEIVISKKGTKRELKKKNSKKNSIDARMGKLKAIETVVETVRHLQKVKTSSKPNLGRHGSVGVIESGGAGGSRRNSNYLKRSLSQNASMAT